MKKERTLEERIRRCRVLFKELGYELQEEEMEKESYMASFEKDDTINGSVYIDLESKFLEIGYTFTFSKAMSDYLKDKLEDMLEICYEFGCYIYLEKNKEDVSFSVFTKIYFSGLNYFSLKNSLTDYNKCVEILTELLDIGINHKDPGNFNEQEEPHPGEQGHDINQGEDFGELDNSKEED
jgi:hypothetical protein